MLKSPHQCRRAAVRFVSALLCVGAFAAAAELHASTRPLYEIKFQSGTAAWEDRPVAYLAVVRARPLEESNDGYSPSIGIPSIWEEPVEFVWNFGDGTPPVTTGEQTTVRHTFRKQATYTVTLEMKSREGVVQAAATQQVEVKNLSPRIVRMASVESDEAEATVELTADVRDAAEDRLTYRWDFGDGETVEQEDAWRVVHTFPFAGTYPVTLTVSDDDEETDTEVLEVVILGDSDEGAVAGPQTPEEEATGAVVSGFRAETSGALGAELQGTIRPMSGLYLGPVGSGACRFVFAAWDPTNLAHVEAILDMTGVPDGGAGYRFTTPFVHVTFEPDGKTWDALRRSGIGPGFARGLGALLAPVAEGLDEKEREEIADAVGVDPTPSTAEPRWVVRMEQVFE